MAPECTPVGTVSTPFATPDDAPRQGARSDAEGTIHVADEYADALAGVEPGDDVVVVWWGDRADRSRLTVTSRRTGREHGVFDTRSPARPNPILLTQCRVVAVDAGDVTVRGVDMADGSPVLDVKRPLS
jgi:tRNA-Thr(GGU) m(6)t(6)A37 methyltransferase TsaA